MNSRNFKDQINLDDSKGEKLISVFRLMLSAIYLLSLPAISFVRDMEGYGHLPMRAHYSTVIFFIYSIFLFLILRKREKLHSTFKYIFVIIDMTCISACIWVTCTYPEVCPPIIYLSIQIQFYIMLILLGAFRFSVRCSVISGIYAGICLLVVIFANGSALDLPYSAVINSNVVTFRFPLYNELFHIFGIIIAGTITGFACKRHISLFSTYVNTHSKAAEAAAKTDEQTQGMAVTIQNTTDKIFSSSKEIFSTANNQAASVQEIESTINENTQIAIEIAEKTSSVSSIATKMENDVNLGFNLLEQNVGQFEEIKNKNDDVISGINTLGNKITKIHDIIETINAITDQTKVIAFNAALEAASAGEHGKRFSVVSTEVNRLADDISALTKEIRKQANDIQNSSTSLIKSSKESSIKINQGNNLIKELENIFREIRNGAEVTANQAQTITISSQKQQKSTKQINIAITDIASGLTNFIQSTRVVTSSAEELVQLMQQLESLIKNKINTGKDIWQ
ncbi:MAG: methyl-accepting chemotaxis protein [Treponema sp.]|nr:methyl-accepting chemotaxis protein [Treponema sp.]